MDISLFYSPKGRIARGPFWLGILSLTALNMLLGTVPVVGAVAPVLLLWPQIALYAKRLHDFGWSAWMWLLPLVVDVACAVVMYMSNPAAMIAVKTPEQLQALILSPAMHTSLIAVEVMGAVQLVFLLWAGITKGDAQSNRFGPVPSARVI